MGGAESKPSPPLPLPTPPPPPPLFNKPWRDVSTMRTENLSYVRSYRPRNNEVQHLRILLHGPVGAGKSTFINSVMSVLQGRMVTIALTDAISGRSFTKKWTTYKIEKEEGCFYSLALNDIMGLERDADRGLCVEDVITALRGHVPEGYMFNPEGSLKEDDTRYILQPSLEDRVHVLVSVIPANNVSLLSDGVLEKMKKIRQEASDMGIPQVAILTKVDQACPEVKDNVKNMYRSKYLKEQVDKFHMKLGLPQNCIFLVKNCIEDDDLQDLTSDAILFALNRIVSYGEDYLNRQFSK